MNTRYGIAAALALSLSVNLLAGGVLLGRLLRPAPEPPPMVWALSDLEPALRRRLGPRLRERLAEVRPARRELRSARGDLRAALLSEPLDRAAASAALARLREGRDRYRALLHDSLLDMLEELPAERREAALRGFARGRAAVRGPGPRVGR